MGTMNTKKAARALISAAVAATMLATYAQAATLTNVEGAVSVSHGGAYTPVPMGAKVVPGDRIRTGDGSSASIVYENGYAQKVGPNQVAAVQHTPPQPGSESASFAPPVGLGALAIGGAVIGGTVAVAAAVTSSSNSNSKNSVSP
jgi:hypothetical protein